MFKDELKKTLATAIDDLNHGRPVLALSALHAAFNRIEQELAAEANGKTELGRVVRENASLRITLQQQAETITTIRANTSRDFEEIALLQAENDGLSSDLRKCQTELAAVRAENGELIRERSASTLKPSLNATPESATRDAIYHVNRRIDGLSVAFQSTWAKHESRLEFLEKRLAQLNHL